MRRAAVLLALVGLVLGAACAPASVVSAPDLTGGVSLDAFVRRDGTSYARYRVRPDGSFAYGGAQDAIDRTFTWHDVLRPAELDAFRSHVAPLRAAGEVRDAKRGAAGTVEIELTTPDGRTDWRGPVDDERIAALLALFDRAARRRNDADLEMLPRASTTPGTERSR